MKKVITIVMIICIMLCGCAQTENDNSTAESTKEPNEISPATSNSAKTSVDAPVEETITANTTCAMCGRITECTPFIDKNYDYELDTTLEKAFYLCPNCYPKVEDSYHDYKLYVSFKVLLDLFFTDEECQKIDTEYSGFDNYNNVKNINDVYRPGIITLDKEGIHLTFSDNHASQCVRLDLYNYLGEESFSKYKTKKETYTFKLERKISNGGASFSIVNENNPTNIIDKLG